MRAPFVLVLVLTLAACDGPAVGTEDAAVMLPACMPALETPLARLRIAPRGIAVIMVDGGTGRPQFDLEPGGTTGSRIEEATGVFVAGTSPGEETIIVTDERCAGDVSVIVEVTTGLTITPVSSEVAPGTSIAFRTDGGSGSVSFEIARDRSGAMISATGAYVAGGTEGEDVVRATDSVTGETADAAVRVRAGAGLTVLPGRLGIPVGSRHVLDVRGGSGVVDVTSSSGSITIDGRTAVAMTTGDATLTVTDRFTGMTATVSATALGSRTADSTWTGDRSELNVVLSGDFDDDGVTDAAVALPGANVAAYRAGAVLLFRGTASGLETPPVRVLTGVRREDAFGSALALGDLDDDGVDDLIVGVWQDDSVGNNAGAVRVYRGVPGRFFEDEPYLSVFGAAGNDRFGAAVTACDFDGDGDVDLAVGAPDDEDNAIVPARSSEGAVHVFPSYGGRILGRADTVLFGAVPDGAGGFTSHANLRFGSALVSGDVDGDDACDLVVHALRPDPMTANDGSVSVYRGLPPAMGRPEGGVAAEPAAVWAAMNAADRGSRLGVFLAAGDLDGDGLAEIVAAAPNHDRPMMGMDAARNDAGAVYVFRGQTLDARATMIRAASDAALVIEGTTASGLLGHGIALGDDGGDGVLDLVAAESRASVMGSELTRPGLVSVFAGVRGALPSSSAARTVTGVGNDERFGNGLAVLGGSRLLLMAPFFDGDGIDVGGLYLSEPSGASNAIDLPGHAAGRRLGQSVDLVGDLTGDGMDDLVVGAPHQPDPTGMRRGLDYGAAYVYAGDGTGFATAPTATLAGYTLATGAGHSESDWMGEVVSRAGDFDGDGREDVAVAIRFEDQPAMFDAAAWTVDAACGMAARNNVGAIAVYAGVASSGTLGEPSFLFFHPQADRTIQMVAGDLDVNGDGRSDLIVGGSNWLHAGMPAERRGGYAVLFGRARGALPIIRCTPDFRVDGAALNDELGVSAARIGDLDGDGCDEVAIGAPRVDRTGATDEGAVHVLFGFGAMCARPMATSIILIPNDRTSTAGTSVVGGVDLDGGGLPDLVVGAPRFVSPVGEVGRVYVLSGEQIARQVMASAPVPFATVAVAGTWYVDGGGAGERLGWSVAVLDGMPRSVVAGGIYGGVSGTPNSGAVRIFEIGRTGLGPLRALITGETTTGYPELGVSVAARRGVVAVGASWGSGDMPEEGSVYVFRP